MLRPGQGVKLGLHESLEMAEQSEDWGERTLFL